MAASGCGGSGAMRDGRTMRRATLALAALLGGCGTFGNHHGPLVAEPATCADFSISIYFDAGSWRITREAEALIRTAALRTRGCAVSTVEVTGLSDAPG